MESKFTHFLITRYNIQLDKWESDIHGQPTLQDDWMKHRFELFSTYCFPSVVAQREKKFFWLIYLETSTPSLHLQQIQALVDVYPFIHLRLVNGYFGCKEAIDEELKHAHTPFVITSRVDNDDALGVDYIRNVQAQFVARDKTMINLLQGYSYIPGDHVATRLSHMERNSFSSFIEEHRVQGGHISVRGFPHGDPPPGTQIIDVDTPGSWLKIFHERNVSSTPFGYPVFTGQFAKHYGIDKRYLTLDFISTLRYSLRWAMDGFNRKVLKVFKAPNT
jgi:hypothetical protein